MATLGLSRYGVGVKWKPQNQDATVSKTYNGLNFTSDVASIKAAAAYEFVDDLESIGTNWGLTFTNVDLNQSNSVTQ